MNLFMQIAYDDGVHFWYYFHLVNFSDTSSVCARARIAA